MRVPPPHRQRERHAAALLRHPSPEALPCPTTTLALHELAHRNGRRAYTGRPSARAAPASCAHPRRSPRCRPNPIRIRVPIAGTSRATTRRRGQDQCLPAPADARAEVALDAAGSSGDPEIAEYVWHLPPGAPCPLVRGARATVELPPGRHRIRLEVIGGTGGRDDDELVVEIGSSP